MSRVMLSQGSMVIILVILLAPDASFADPRAQVVALMCGNKLSHNPTTYVPNFITTMEYLSMQLRTGSGFAMATAGPGLDTSYGLVQCYGDLNSTDCVLCYAQARTVLPMCYPENGGRIFLDGCFMRVENYSFFQEYTGPKDHVVCQNTNQTNPAFPASARQAISQAVAYAPKNQSYGSAQVAVPGTTNEFAHVLANCWKTLDSTECETCLRNASASISRCLPQLEGRALNTGCFMRYSLTFENGSSRGKADPLAPGNGSSIGKVDSLAPGNGSSRGRKTVGVIAVAAAIAAILIIGTVIGICMWRKSTGIKERKDKLLPIFCGLKKDKPQDYRTIELFLKDNENFAPRRYKYSDLKKITNSFSDTLGKGGFGSVYKGKMHDGRLVAVKILTEAKSNGEEFINEVASISRTSHVNIVTLLGFCFEGSRRALVYEFMPNGSLEKFLHDPTSATGDGRFLRWEQLFEIALATARGLQYLHQGCSTRILHLDIKPHNILLDKDMQPKISDFGLAKLCPNRASIISILGARGTIGYIAPEVFCKSFGEVSHKSDVYSYGMMLEMAGLKKSICTKTESSSEKYFPNWIYKHLELHDDKGADIIADQEDEFHLVKRKMAIIGLWCIQTDPKQRPSISKVVEMLEGKLESLQIPPKPHLSSPPIQAAQNQTSELSTL